MTAPARAVRMPIQVHRRLDVAIGHAMHAGVAQPVGGIAGENRLRLHSSLF